MKKTGKHSSVDVSVVIPLYNEEGSLAELHKQIVQALKPRGYRYEVLFIDDGSQDDSFEVIHGLSKIDPNVRAIRLRTNCGKSDALSVGFSLVRGEYVITMDADLQDDPDEIPSLIDKLEEGYDLISGWKKERFDPLSKRIPSRFFNKITALISGIPLHDFNCGLKAYRREVTQEIPVYGELHRYLPVLAKWQGYRIGELAVTHHPRKYGVTKFGFARFYRGFFDLLTVIFLTRYLKRPMHFFGIIGAIVFFIGFAINLHLSILWLRGIGIGERPMLLLGVLMQIIGTQFFSIGLVGEMIANMRSEKRSYSIRETIDPLND
ncbi:MAG: glycosyltransferase [Candidatus Cloacimonetes bacterium 4572_55]|nr:MAG: glycosyltransferase [Candidatus Cloacimonetes bacterium 4572_55]